MIGASLLKENELISFYFVKIPPRIYERLVVWIEYGVVVLSTGELHS
jgi:hypothetical protein